MRQPTRRRAQRPSETADLKLAHGSGALARAVASQEACPTSHEQAVIRERLQWSRHDMVINLAVKALTLFVSYPPDDFAAIVGDQQAAIV
jgi:hypothetical protein